MRKMTREPDFNTGASYCGNCGTPVQAGAIACANCGSLIPGATTGTGPAQGTGGPMPADYIPYCRSCGVVVNWGEGHTCNRCGITPLCALHFRAGKGCASTAQMPARHPGLPHLRRDCDAEPVGLPLPQIRISVPIAAGQSPPVRAGLSTWGSGSGQGRLL